MMISEKVQKDKIIFENKNLGINITQSGMIDSDDEDKLESYDLTNDTINVKIKKPVYLRDCLNCNFLKFQKKFKLIHFFS